MQSLVFGRGAEILLAYLCIILVYCSFEAHSSLHLSSSRQGKPLLASHVLATLGQHSKFIVELKGGAIEQGSDAEDDTDEEDEEESGPMSMDAEETDGTDVAEEEGREAAEEEDDATEEDSGDEEEDSDWDTAKEQKAEAAGKEELLKNLPSVSGKSKAEAGLLKPLLDLWNDPAFAPTKKLIVMIVPTVVIMKGVNMMNHDAANAKKNAQMMYACYLVLVQLFCLFCKFRIKVVNNLKEVEVPHPWAKMASSMAAGEGEEGKSLPQQMVSKKMTVKEYDNTKVNELRNAQLVPMFMMWFLGSKKGLVKPLVVQAAFGVYSLFTNPLFKVYILGQDLERPFKGPMDDLAKKMADPPLGAEAEQEEVSSSEASDSTKEADNDSDEEESNSS